MFVYPHENQMNIVHIGTYPNFPVFSVGWNLCIKKCYASTWMHNSCLNKDKWRIMFNVLFLYRLVPEKNCNVFFFSCFLLIILHSWFGKAWKLEAHTRKIIYLFCMVEDFSWQGLDAGTIHHLALLENSP